MTRLDQAREALAQIPTLFAQLPAPTDPRVSEGGGTGKITGSPALVRLDVLSLTDARRKADWDGADPREQRVIERFGVAPALESWTRVVSEEHPDPPEMAETATVASESSYLLGVWDWITEQQWADELAQDVLGIHGMLRDCCGIRKGPRYRCVKCGNPAVLADGFMVCTECPHEESVRDVEGQYRRRPAMSTDDIATEFEIEPNRIRVWRTRGKIRPAPGSAKGKPLWFPWDVFCLLHPDIAEAFERRDKIA